MVGHDCRHASTDVEGQQQDRETHEQREREHFLLLGYLRAELDGTPIEGRISTLRLALLMFVESVVVLDAAISRVVAEHMSGHPVLFRDCADNLQRQVEMAARLSGHFNRLAGRAGVAEINLEEVRDSLRAQIDEQVASWCKLARLEMLSEFGQEAVMRTLLEQILPPPCGSVPTSVIVPLGPRNDT